MKSVLISIRPRWCAKIANGNKTIEVRKTRPKLGTPFKVYIYCTLPGTKDPRQILELHGADGKICKANGKVMGEFVCDKIYELTPINHAPDDTEQQACLTREEIVRYLKGVGYGWHISDLKIYEQPRKLDEFAGIRTMKNGFELRLLDRPPQSWCYVAEGQR